MNLMVRPNKSVLDIKPYVAGEGKIAGVERVIKLASNENPLGPSPKAIAAFQTAAQNLALYPDPEQAVIKSALSELHGIDGRELIVSNGSEALLDLAIRTYAGPGDEVLFPRYSFPVYPIAARAAGAMPIEAEVSNWGTDVDALLAAVTPKTKVVIIANPNNPTGTWIDKAALGDLRARLDAHILLIIDSAYAEYMDMAAYSAGHELVREGGNVIVTRTLSKAYGLASARVGWAHASADAIDVLRRVRAVFPVTGPSQAAAVVALQDQDHVHTSVALNNRLLPWFKAELHKLRIATPDHIGGNFVLGLFHDWPGGAKAADAALRKRGITARLVGVPEGLRISIGLEDQMKAVLTALKG